MARLITTDVINALYLLFFRFFLKKKTIVTDGIEIKRRGMVARHTVFDGLKKEKGVCETEQKRYTHRKMARSRSRAFASQSGSLLHSRLAPNELIHT